MKPTGNPLVDRMYSEMVRGMVARQITCLRTGEVLDVRTCVVLVDRDGDPHTVLSQDGWAQVVASGGDVKLAALGVTVDETTVRP